MIYIIAIIPRRLECGSCLVVFYWHSFFFSPEKLFRCLSIRILGRFSDSNIFARPAGVVCICTCILFCMQSSFLIYSLESYITRYSIKLTRNAKFIEVESEIVLGCYTGSFDTVQLPQLRVQGHSDTRYDVWKFYFIYIYMYISSHPFLSFWINLRTFGMPDAKSELQPSALNFRV